MNKTFYIAGGLVVAVLIGVGIFVIMPGGSNLPSAASPTPSPISNPSPSPAPTPVVPAPSPVTPPPAPPATPPAADQATITYTDSGFSPSVLTITAGTTVTFLNKSSEPFWPASNPHPIHNGYPTTGGCRTSTFDACGGIAPGGSWSFQFKIHGSWGYHDHLNPGAQGTIVVQ